jgi:hypothetical protein
MDWERQRFFCTHFARRVITLPFLMSKTPPKQMADHGPSQAQKLRQRYSKECRIINATKTQGIDWLQQRVDRAGENEILLVNRSSFDKGKYNASYPIQ